MLRHGGSLGLIATNTIAQGDTRTGGLACILASDGSIFRVVRRLRWPGEAAVIVSVVHVGRGPIKDQAWIDGRRVNRISAFLIDGETDTDPFRLTAVPFFSLGSKICGQGFLFADGDDSASPLSAMKLLVDKYSTLTGMRIFPYIGGEEVNSDPTRNTSVRRSAATGWPLLMRYAARGAGMPVSRADRHQRVQRAQSGENPRMAQWTTG